VASSDAALLLDWSAVLDGVNSGTVSMFLCLHSMTFVTPSKRKKRKKGTQLMAVIQSTLTLRHFLASKKLGEFFPKTLDNTSYQRVRAALVTYRQTN
jgi:hypothetical protein